MNLKKVKTIRSSLRTVEGGGFPVRRPFPVRDLIQLDPFLLLDEMGPVEYKPGKAIGAPEHPHRGFETVTYLLTGEMEHRDSWGNYGKLKSGDVQWMTAGSGLVHSELPSNDFQKNGGRMHGFQLWVNLPSSQKNEPSKISGHSF
ncbi:pirin family protein [Leptospira santarosai str. CBC1416]|uniref:Pirin family protein n=1 Tax=Leptospira santarosai str. CBC1416 TaxID=1193059 RepID=M6VLM5_9LEPT|nr:pirin family protein [Leptospira santarosai str. CBC1416]